MLLNKIVKISSIILRIRTWGLCLKNNSQSESNQPYVITPVGFYLHGRVGIVDDTFRNRWSLKQTTTIKKKQTQSGISDILLLQHKTRFLLA